MEGNRTATSIDFALRVIKYGIIFAGSFEQSRWSPKLARTQRGVAVIICVPPSPVAFWLASGFHLEVMETTGKLGFYAGDVAEYYYLLLM